MPSMKNLIIVESPNKVETIKSLLKGTEFEGTTVMASKGHIVKIKDSKGSYYFTGIHPDKDFKVDWCLIPDSEKLNATKIVDALKKQVEIADKVYIASDPDREGEFIAWSLKKWLKIPDSKARRITFHEVTKNAVLKALNNPTKIDNNLVDSAETRKIIDRILGYRLSGIARKALGAKSVGRCQSPTLMLVDEKENEIRNFVPEEYYDIALTFQRKGIDFKAKYVGTSTEEIKRVKDFEQAKAIMLDCMLPPYIFGPAEKKQVKKGPKPPFITSTFCQEVVNRLGVGVDGAMSYAQRLFEGISINGEHIALITYIRTDNPEFSPEFIPVLKKYIVDNYGQKYYHDLRKVKKSENAQDGHEAIRPVDLSMTPEKLADYIDDEKLIKVYSIIYNRTLATMMADSVVSETTYPIYKGEHRFNLVSKELVFDGFKRVYAYKEKDEEEDIVTLTFEEGEAITEKDNPKLISEKKQTNPPARYKQDTLLKKIEDTGIGRPSTYASIVKTVLDPGRNYCSVDDKQVYITPLGEKLSKYLSENYPDIISVNYTAELEKELDLVAHNEKKKLEVVKEFYDKLEESINIAENEPRVCPNCLSPLVLRKGKYGQFFGCSKYPECKYVEKK